MKTLPTALIIGPQKAGTSWLQEYFSERDDVCLPSGVKEVFFFDRYFSKGIDWYAAHFKQKSAAHVICLEVGPTIFEEPLAPKRVRETLGDIPIICTFRDPAERTWSLYQHMQRYGMTRLPFRQAVEELHLYRGSQYFERLEEWKSQICSDNILVTFVDDLAREPDEFVNRICRHLSLGFREIPERLRGKFFEGGSSPNYWVARITTIVAQVLRSMRLYSVVNFVRDSGLKSLIFGAGGKAEKKQVLSNEDRLWLIGRYFAEDIDKLEQLTNRDLTNWKR